MGNRKIDTLISRAEKVEKYAHLEGLDVKVISISDTIAIVTYGERMPTLDFHTLLSNVLVSKSIDLGIPIRGATSYGSFTISDNIMAGPAVDEVAAWYELANWIGVLFTPSAKLKVTQDYFTLENGRLVEYSVPIKSYGYYNTYCPNWVMSWKANNRKREELIDRFLESTPILPDTYIKYDNTIKFFDEFYDNETENK